MPNYYKFGNGLNDANAYWVSGKPYITGAFAVASHAASTGGTESGWIGVAAISGTEDGGGKWRNSSVDATVTNCEGAPGIPHIVVEADPEPAASGDTNYLVGSEYGLNVPLGATITGFVVDIIKTNSGQAGRPVVDASLHLSKDTGSMGANQEGDNKADTTTNWCAAGPCLLLTSSYGSSTDLWGQSWTPAEANHGRFGVVFQADVQHSNVIADVEAIQVTAHFTDPLTATNTPTITFPTVTQWVQIENGDASEILRYAFSVAGISGSDTDVGEWGLIPPSTTVGPLPLKLTTLYLAGDGSQTVTPVTVIAGLTDLSTNLIEDNWSGSVGVG